MPPEAVGNTEFQQVEPILSEPICNFSNSVGGYQSTFGRTINCTGVTSKWVLRKQAFNISQNCVQYLGTLKIPWRWRRHAQHGSTYLLIITQYTAVLQISCMTRIHVQMRSMEEKSPCNSRPIIGIVIVGEHKTNVKEQVALSHFTKFHFPRQSRQRGLYFFSRSSA